MHSDVSHYAALYLNHLAFGHELSGQELAQAEKSYVMWDWEGLAALAYEQFLSHGRGALVGPRVVHDEEMVTVLFDYITPQAGLETLNTGCQMRLISYVLHYHPELDLVVMWRRPDGTADCEWLRSDETRGLLPPRALCAQQKVRVPTKAN